MSGLKRKDTKKHEISGSDKVYDPFNPPSDTHHLFCKNCLNMYNTNEHFDHHILLSIHPDSRGEKMAGMMPLLKAWAAFMNHFTGVEPTFTFVKGTMHGTFYVQDNKVIKEAWGPNSADDFNTVEMRIQDLPLKTLHMGDKPRPSYAFMGGYREVTFKSGILLAMRPEEALTMMVHEFTAHRLCVDFGKLYEEGRPEVEFRDQHYGGSQHPFETTLHCVTDRKSKDDRDQTKCLNGFIDLSYNNFKNAEPFFKNWYENHKDDPIRMYGDSK
jgi:hypothetical protein